MVKRKFELLKLSAVAASKTTVVDLPIGPRYHQLIVQELYSGGTNTLAGAATNITDIAVKVNGRVQRQMSGTQLRDMNLLNGVSYDGQGVPNTAAGLSLDGASFPIFFAEPWRQRVEDQDALAWPSAQWNSMQLEITLGAATSPALRVWAIADDFIPKDPQMICKWNRATYNASGTKFATALERKDWLQQISMYVDSGGSNLCTRATLKKNAETVTELTYGPNYTMLASNGMYPVATGRTATIFDIVLDHDGLLYSAVNLAEAREATLTVEAASAMSGTITAIEQRLGLPD